MEQAKRDRIVAFYEKHNPENVKNIPEILRVFAGREDVLCAKLFKKYGCQPDLQTLAPVAAPVEYVYTPTYVPYEAQKAGSGPLDYRSPSFDATVALHERRPLPNMQSVMPLDNLNKCRPLLPESDPNYNGSIGQSKPKTKTAVAPKVAPAPQRPPLLETIADLCADGPLNILRAILKARAKVCVVIRRVNSIRGTCTGYLKGFDKHFNIILLDVTERYVPLVSGEQPADAPSIATWPHTHAVKKRFLRQLLIRGDNVVLVYPTQPLPKAQSAG
ncbi:hypothetical protein ACHHYP_09738 [Achlya hypogyna]|uniref:Sm domain-containing protein n=1 Tax=Achlya hypogyna TaxID=1202772 RepID=A0A1V9YMI3_ACHHY|nr:hypothetical protein ACHHYP_09738 [Achlya hypogyna]